jgi:hypothetical protein
MKRIIIGIHIAWLTISSSLYTMQRENQQLYWQKIVAEDACFRDHFAIEEDHDFEIVSKEKPKNLDLFDLSCLENRETSQKKVFLDRENYFYIYDKNLIDAVFKPIQDDNFIIRQFYRVASSKKHYKQHGNRSLYVVIHGTMAQNNPTFFDVNCDSFKGLLHSIAVLAEFADQEIDVLSLSWSGENSDNARIHAGIRLGHFINMMAAHNNKDGSPYYKDIAFLAHSHGGNVALVAANFYLKQWFSSTKLYAFLLATPVLQKFFWGYSPKNLEKMVVVQSSEDDVPNWGWWTAWIWKKHNPCSRWNLCAKDELYNDAKTYQPHDQGSIVHVDCYVDNEAPAHDKIVAPFFNTIFDVISLLREEFYDPSIQSLIMNILPDEKAKKFETSKILMALLPRNSKEEERYKKLPKKTIECDKKYRDKQVEIYGKDDDSYLEYYIYSRWRTIKKLWGSI